MRIDASLATTLMAVLEWLKIAEYEKPKPKLEEKEVSTYPRQKWNYTFVPEAIPEEQQYQQAPDPTAIDDTTVKPLPIVQPTPTITIVPDTTFDKTIYYSPEVEEINEENAAPLTTADEVIITNDLDGTEAAIVRDIYDSAPDLPAAVLEEELSIVKTIIETPTLPNPVEDDSLPIIKTTTTTEPVEPSLPSTKTTLSGL